MRLASNACLACLLALAAGCVSDRVDTYSPVTAYQQTLAHWGPQPRVDGSEPLGLLEPAPPEQKVMPELKVTTDPNTGKKSIRLTVDQAVVRALANSPEIRVVSFDPEIARQEITKAAAEFDPTVFSQYNYEDQDNPKNGFSDIGQLNTRAWESGVKQKGPTGAEWSASYAFVQTWDDYYGRTYPKRYEPMMVFQLKQPLLRGAWGQVNLAGVDVARLNYRIAMLGFRQKAEELSTAVITAYWQLRQARQDLDAQRRLLEQTLETANKVDGRREIDATDVQVQQARAYAKSRQALLLEYEKRVADARDALTRLMADAQVNISSDVEVVPVSEPQTTSEGLQAPMAAEPLLAKAMEQNSFVRQAKLAIDVADINLRVADNERMPRLDLISSATAKGLSDNPYRANDQIGNGQYTGYAVGLAMEFPLGDRAGYAEQLKRKLERRKAVATLHNVTDQVAAQVKERIRKVETNLAEIGIEKQAVEASRAQLQALENTEAVREQLTAEFLLVKLQAQDMLAQAERAQSGAIAGFNISVAELALSTGTVLEMRPIEASLSAITPPQEVQASPPPGARRRAALTPVP
jgi:outer membrane protein